MRRAVRAIVLFVLVGAAVNVAVAWGCALWSPITDIQLFVVNDRQAVSDIGGLVPRDWLNAGESASHYVRTGLGIRVHVFYVWFPAPGNRFLYVHRAGYPWASVECDSSPYIVNNIIDGTSVDPRGWRSGMVPPAFLGATGRGRMGGVASPLPLRPIWGGFLLNTLVYSALAGLLCGVMQCAQVCVRRRRRAQRGLCIACGYAQGLATCPECGRASA